MAFVKDRQRFTRGPGAIAAFDAVRPRARAVVRASPGLPRNLGVRHAAKVTVPDVRIRRARGSCPQGCFPLADGTCDCPYATPSSLRGMGAVQIDDGGGAGGGSNTGGGVPVPPRRAPSAQIGQIVPTSVKYPGVPSPLPPRMVPPTAVPTSSFGTNAMGTRTPTVSTYPPLHPPARPPVVSTAGGGAAISPPLVQIPEAIEDEPDEFPNITLPATEAAPPAKSSKTLLVAAALGGLWLLLRR